MGHQGIGVAWRASCTWLRLLHKCRFVGRDAERFRNREDRLRSQSSWLFFNVREKSRAVAPLHAEGSFDEFISSPNPFLVRADKYFKNNFRQWELRVSQNVEISVLVFWESQWKHSLLSLIFYHTGRQQFKKVSRTLKNSNIFCFPEKTRYSRGKQRNVQHIKARCTDCVLSCCTLAPGHLISTAHEMKPQDVGGVPAAKMLGKKYRFPTRLSAAIAWQPAIGSLGCSTF